MRGRVIQVALPLIDLWEIRHEAKRQGRSFSWIVQRAWLIARRHFHSPGLAGG